MQESTEPAVVKTLTIIVPIFNEGECIKETVLRLDAVRSQLACTFSVNYIFIDDGSFDGSTDKVRDMSKSRSYLSLVVLTRNFGHQIAVTAGLDACKTDYACILDADMQDPPEVIPAMMKMAIDENLNVVYGQRRQRNGESWFKRTSSKAFYRLLNFLCDITIPPDTGDFRIIDRRVIKVLSGMRERDRFVRGLIPWTGLRAKAFIYDRNPRYAGETKYPCRRMLSLAANAIFAFSNKPLRIATVAGMILILLTMTVLMVIITLRLFTEIYVPGITFVVTLIVLMNSFVILMLGLLGEYVGRIFEQSKGRPLYLVEEVCGSLAATSVFRASQLHLEET